MDRQVRHWAWAAGVVVVALTARPAVAQPPPAASAVSSGAFGTTNMGMLSNPYANPYLNPFLNPYMTQGQVPGNAAFYLFAAQQANGGIGSGRLSGVRPARPAASARSAAPSPRRVTDTPGAGAARYFNRSYEPPTSTSRYYNRQGRYYSSNAR